jgi:hypothetical protein
MRWPKFLALVEGKLDKPLSRAARAAVYEAYLVKFQPPTIRVKRIKDEETGEVRIAVAGAGPPLRLMDGPPTWLIRGAAHSYFPDKLTRPPRKSGRCNADLNQAIPWAETYDRTRCVVSFSRVMRYLTKIFTNDLLVSLELVTGGVAADYLRSKI